MFLWYSIQNDNSVLEKQATAKKQSPVLLGLAWEMCPLSSNSQTQGRKENHFKNTEKETNLA